MPPGFHLFLCLPKVAQFSAAFSAVLPRWKTQQTWFSIEPLKSLKWVKEASCCCHSSQVSIVILPHSSPAVICMCVRVGHMYELRREREQPSLHNDFISGDEYETGRQAGRGTRLEGGRGNGEKRGKGMCVSKVLHRQQHLSEAMFHTRNFSSIFTNISLISRATFSQLLTGYFAVSYCCLQLDKIACGNWHSLE